MPTGKRASMREGPLAALFRKTAEDTAPPGKQPSAEAPSDHPVAAPHAPPSSQPAVPEAHAAERVEPAEPERRIPSPQERLRHAFSADIPENVLETPKTPDLP